MRDCGCVRECFACACEFEHFGVNTSACTCVCIGVCA